MRQIALLLTCIALLSGCAAKYQIQPGETTVRAVTQRWVADSQRELVWEVDDLEIVRAEGMNKRLESAATLPVALDTLITGAESARRKIARAAGEPWPHPVYTCVYTNAVTVKYLRSAAIPCSPSRPADNR